MRLRHPVTLIAAAVALLLAGAPMDLSAQTEPTLRDSAEALYWRGYEAYQTATRASMLEAIALWDEAAAIYRSLGMRRQLETVWQAIAAAYHSIGDIESAYLFNGRADSAAWYIDLDQQHVASYGSFGFGGTVGATSLGGAANAPIEAGFSGDFFLRYQFAFGLHLVGGVSASSQSISGISQSYRSLGVYVEPRYAFSQVSRTVAPYVGVRIGPVWEAVHDNLARGGVVDAARFRSTGFLAAGTFGLLTKLNARIALETSIGIGSISFADFDFDGTGSWEQCVGPHRVLATPFPATVQDCADLEIDSTALEQARLLAGNDPLVRQCTTIPCQRERIPHPNTARSATWFRFQIGLNISIGIRSAI